MAEPDDSMKPEKRLFAYSVLYLFALFAALVVDRMVLV
jgi:protoheme IX farnesyltransferase